MKYGKLSYQRDRLRLQAFVNALDGEASGVLLLGADERPLSFGFENQAYDVEFSNFTSSGIRHVVSYGGNYRHNNFDLRLAPRRGNRDEGGGYAQDQIFLSNRFRWVVGGRVDRFDVLHKSGVFAANDVHDQAARRPRPSAVVQPRVPRAVLRQQLPRHTVLSDVRPRRRRAVPLPVIAAGNENLKQKR